MKWPIQTWQEILVGTDQKVPLFKSNSAKCFCSSVTLKYEWPGRRLIERSSFPNCCDLTDGNII